MRNFINIENSEKIEFKSSDLPMLIHGKDKTGSSLFSITVAAHLHIQGNKLLIFTAYSMAKDEFLLQVGSDASVFYLENIDDISKAQEYQTIIIKSGNKDLCEQTLAKIADIDSRILFIKNVDQILSNDIVENMKQGSRLLISGDIDLSEYSDFIKSINYKTKVYFSDSTVLPEELLKLEKYQACIIKNNNKFVVSLD